MFTGIVQGQARVLEVNRQPNFMRVQVELPEAYADNLQQGASIALNGTCLTVTAHQKNRVSFDLIEQTLATTNLAQLSPGDLVNFERAARLGDEIGGHLLSGHIHAMATVVRIEQSENNHKIWLTAPQQWRRYILPKGFIALNGCSLTINDCQEDSFSIGLIPETLSVTNFSRLQPNDPVNMEIDSHTQAVVDTVERYLAQQQNVQ